MVKGIGTVIYHVADLDRGKIWYASAFGQQPYFDQPFYVGFNIGGYELGLDPDPEAGKSGPGGRPRPSTAALAMRFTPSG